jgi:hypothetical protein
METDFVLRSEMAIIIITVKVTSHGVVVIIRYYSCCSAHLNLPADNALCCPDPHSYILSLKIIIFLKFDYATSTLIDVYY